MRRTAILLLAGLPLLAACEKKSPPPTPTPGGGGVETIRGTERLGWDQRAGDAAELAAFRYAIYVDGARSVVADSSCGTSAGANGFSCSGRLPAMAAGSHTIEMATFVLDGTTVLESPRSAPLRVNVSSAIASTVADALRRGVGGKTRDGVPLRPVVLIDALHEPSDIAVAPDGRLFVAERDGLFRVFDEGRREQRTSRLEASIVALALDPQFEANHRVYAIEVADGANGDRAFAVTRYREVNATLGERATLLHAVPARQPEASGALGFGPDGRLFVMFDDGGNERSASDPASLNGKLLRLNTDGTTPDDQAGGSPVQSDGFRAPRGLDWSADGILWVAEGTSDSPGRLAGLVVASRRTHRSQVNSTYALPKETDPADAVVYRGDLFPEFRGNLLIGTRDGILRIRFDPRLPARVLSTEKLLEGIGPVHALAMAPGGAIYVCAETEVVKITRGSRTDQR